MSSLEYSPYVKKCMNGHSGLVRIPTSSFSIKCGKTVAFTILDEDDQHGWTRLLVGGSSQSIPDPLEVNIPRSSIGHRIIVTGKVLKSLSFGPFNDVEHMRVASEDSCIATEDLAAAGAHSLSHLMSRMAVSAAAESRQISNTIQVSIEIEQVTTSNNASVTIRHPPTVRPTHWVISVKPNPYICHHSCIEHVFVLPRQGFLSKQCFDFDINFAAGKTYQVAVQGLDVVAQPSKFVENSEFRIIAGGSVDFKAELTKTDLNTLHLRAVEHAGQYNHARCDYLYRNKPQPYFDDIFQNHRGLMEVYIKDNSGDPGSPINGKIKGLFFMASVEPGSTTGEPTRISAFGGTRLLIPVKTLLQMAPNLYFADFYCMRGRFHYVTLVMTRRGSEADVFCSQRLPLLKVYDRSRNPFLFYDGNGQLQVSTTDRLHVEVLFTEDLDINQYKNDLKPNTPLIGKGETTPGGLRKKADCPVCNLSLSYTYNNLLPADDF